MVAHAVQCISDNSERFVAGLTVGKAKINNLCVLTIDHLEHFLISPILASRPACVVSLFCCRDACCVCCIYQDG